MNAQKALVADANLFREASCLELGWTLKEVADLRCAPRERFDDDSGDTGANVASCGLFFPSKYVTLLFATCRLRECASQPDGGNLVCVGEQHLIPPPCDEPESDITAGHPTQRGQKCVCTNFVEVPCTRSHA